MAAVGIVKLPSTSMAAIFSPSLFRVTGDEFGDAGLFQALVGGVGSGPLFLVRCLLLAVLHKVAIAHRGLRNVRRIVR